MTTGTFFCGKMGAGKTTLSRSIARERKAVLISEDEWLAANQLPVAGEEALHLREGHQPPGHA
jgi:shikimate kinase